MDSLHGNITTLTTLCSGASTESHNLTGLSVCDPLTLCAIHDIADYQNVLFANDATAQFLGFDVSISKTIPTQSNKGTSIKNQGATISADNSQICIDYTPNVTLKDDCIFINFCWLYFVTYGDGTTCNETITASFKLCFNGESLDNLTITNEDGSELEDKICTSEDDTIKITPDLTEIDGYKITPQISIDGSEFVNAGSLINQTGLNFAQCQQAESTEITQTICSGASLPLQLSSVDVVTTGGTETLTATITDINQIFALLMTSNTQFECIGDNLYANGEVINITLNTPLGASISIPFTECEFPLCYSIFKDRLTPDREYCIKFVYTVNEIDEGNTIECEDLKVNIDIVINQTNTNQNQLNIIYGFSSIAQADIVNATISAGQSTYPLLVSGNFLHVQNIGLPNFDGFIDVELANGCIYQQVFSIPLNTNQTLVIQGM